MKQFTFVVIALALGIPASTPARQQTAAPDDGKREFIVSGCLLRNGYAGYAVEDSRVVAIDAKRLPDPAPASAPAMPKKWILDGGGNLGPRTKRIPHLDVKTVKTVASGCA
jgi:hypothetical protein